MKTSTVTPSFYYVFNISLYCYDTIPNFIGNLWRVLLPGNHLKLPIVSTRISTFLLSYLAWKETKLVLLKGYSTPQNNILEKDSS